MAEEPKAKGATAPAAGTEAKPMRNGGQGGAPRRAAGEGAGRERWDLLQEVEIPLSVEIGRTRLLVKEILELKQGSVITLDKEAEEPMDIRVNGRLVARGEIVVVKDAFGVRITEVVGGGGGAAS